MNKLTFIPIIGIPEIKSGDNIPEIINKGLNTNKINLKNNDVLVITQKIISKSDFVFSKKSKQSIFFTFILNSKSSAVCIIN